LELHIRHAVRLEWDPLSDDWTETELDELSWHKCIEEFGLLLGSSTELTDDEEKHDFLNQRNELLCLVVEK
jgi:hypothetical protein